MLRPTGRQARRPVVGAVEQGLLEQGRRYALGLRLIVVALSSTASLLLTQAPQQALTVAIVVALNCWNLAYAWGLLRGSASRWAMGRWAVADVVVICAVCLSQLWTVRSDPRSGGTWVLIAMVITLVTSPWQLPGPALVAATVTIIAVHYLGAMIADPGGWLVSEAVVVWTAAEVTLSWIMYRFVRRSARAADRAIERAQELRRAAAVAAARRADEREYLAALHDTASVTLMMIGNGVLTRPEPWLAEQAQRDLEEVGRAGPGQGGDLDLITVLHEAARHVRLQVTWRTPDSLLLPAVDAVTLSRGAREALTNVVRHAGVDRADVSVRHDATRVTVEISDQGAGFAPDQVESGRYGVTGSLRERMANRGGDARINSSPGRGTTVTLSGPPSVGAQNLGDEGLIAGGFQRGLRRAVVVLSLAILILLDLPHLLTGADAYTHIEVQYAAWSGLFATTVVMAVATWRDRPVRRWPLLAVVAICSMLATATVRPEFRLGPAHWSEGDAGWQTVLVMMDGPPTVLAAVLAAQYLVTFAQAAVDQQAALSVAGVVNATWLVLAFQLAVAMIAAVLRSLAGSSARALHAAESLRTSDEVTRQVHRDHERRFETLEATTVPLLRGLADGRLDPGEADVRQACAAEAARIRRLLVEGGSTPDQLAHELRACLEQAESQGLAVSFAEYGARPDLPPEVVRRLIEPSITALATARGKVRLTVAGTGHAVTVSIVAQCAAPVELPDSDGIRHSTLREGDRWWIRADWQDAS